MQTRTKIIQNNCLTCHNKIYLQQSNGDKNKNRRSGSSSSSSSSATTLQLLLLRNIRIVASIGIIVSYSYPFQFSILRSILAAALLLIHKKRTIILVWWEMHFALMFFAFHETKKNRKICKQPHLIRLQHLPTSYEMDLKY